MPRKPLPHVLAAQADRLSLNDLKQLVAYLSAQIQERESIVEAKGLAEKYYTSHN